MEAIPSEVREKTLAIHRRLTETGIPHAFGGAIAFGYAGVPRATLDIDVDIFLPDEDGEGVIQVLRQLGVEALPEYTLERMHTDSQTRLLWSGVKVDLFFAFAAFHDAVQARVSQETFDGALIPVISAEDIVAFKLMFDRKRDWVDIESVLATRGRTFDIDYVRGWLVEMLGADDSRIARLEELARETWERTDQID